MCESVLERKYVCEKEQAREREGKVREKEREREGKMRERVCV